MKRKIDVPAGEYPPKRPTLNAESAAVTAAAMKAANGDRKQAATILGVKAGALAMRLVHMRRHTEFDFPDSSYREPGVVQRETVEAMRAAGGDRRIAAKQLGIRLDALAARLSNIRNIRDALED